MLPSRTMAQFSGEGVPVSNLLLITDVARLRKIFGRLTEDKNIRLRIVNNLEKGGEEIAIEKPDVVFVQTHLSGLSADILIMHLKKQLGRKRSRFVLLATPSQTTPSILKPFQGWLDTSADDSQLLAELHQLLVTLLNKPKKSAESAPAEPIVSQDFVPQPIINAEPSATLSPVPETAPLAPTTTLLQHQIAAPAVPEQSLEEQGITYAPRQRLSVYSEFNSSFDNAVDSTPEPEPLEQKIPAISHDHDWNAETIDTIDAKPSRSKNGAFLLWLAPVIIAVIVITYLQQKNPPRSPEPPSSTKAIPVTTAKPAAQTPPQNVPVPAPPMAPAPPSGGAAATPQNQDLMSDKAVLSAIAENHGSKSSTPAPSTPSARLENLPDFIPRYGHDKQYSATNPGWERYKGQVTEFKVLREAQKIKVIQVIDRGGNGVPESFMRAVLHQVTKKPALKPESSEKKEGYEVQRGKIADNIRVVYYRDENGGKLRAFVLTWQ